MKYSIYLSLYCSQEALPCDFGYHRAISDTGRSNAQKIAFRLVNAGNFLITASLAIFVEEVSLVYVAYDGDIEVVSINFIAWGLRIVFPFQCSIK